MNPPAARELQEKYVLCIPRWCGLNDTLVQIWLAYRYAEMNARQLLIDTRVSGFWDDFDNYFTLTAATRNGSVPITLHVTDTDLAYLNTKRAFPHTYAGRLDHIYHEIHLRVVTSYEHSRINRSLSFAKHALRQSACMDRPLSFSERLRFLAFVASPTRRSRRNPLATTRTEDLIVHHESGGGRESVLALSLFTLSPELQSVVHEALLLCGDDYDAIHVRNTDIESAHRDLFQHAKERLAGRRVLVCSDDADILDKAPGLLPTSDVFTVTETESTHGRPLHKLGGDRSPEERRKLNYSMIVDLMCLAKSQDLLVARPKNGPLSGFSALAQSLHNRADLLQQLTGIP